MILWDQRYFLTNIFITTNGNLSAYFAIVEKQYGQIPRSRLVINALVETHYFICGKAMSLLIFPFVEKQYGQIPRSPFVMNVVGETHYFIY